MHNRHFFGLDTLFSDKFFTAPPKKESNDSQPAFPMPSNPATMSQFFNSSMGNQYISGVQAILTTIGQWAIEHHINAEPLKDFYDKNFTSPANQLSAYPLYTEGVVLLFKISRLIRNENIPLDLRRSVLNVLFSELNVCDAGTHDNIVNAYLKLERDAAYTLMDMRREYVVDIVSAVIHEFNLEIFEGNEKHYGTVIIKHLEKHLGVHGIDDVNALNYINQDSANFIYNELIKRLPVTMTVDNLLDRLCNEVGFQEFAAKIQTASATEVKDLCDALSRQLACYGDDTDFVVTSLFNEDELADNHFVLSRDALYVIYTTLMRRLLNGGFIDSRYQDQLIFDDKTTIFLFPNRSIKFAYVCVNGATKPLISFCLDKSTQSDLSLVKMQLSDKQMRELDDVVTDILDDMAKRIISEDNPTQEVMSEWLSIYLNLFGKVPLFIKHIFLEQRHISKLFINYLYDGFSCSSIISLQDLIVSLRDFFQSHSIKMCDLIGYDKLASFAKSGVELCQISQLLPSGERLPFLLKIDVKRLVFLVDDGVQISDLLTALPSDKAMHFIFYMHGGGELKSIINNTNRLRDLLNFINERDYETVILHLLGIDHVMRLITKLSDLIYILSSFPIDAPEKRMELLRQIGFNHLRSLLKEYREIGRVFSHFQCADYHELFNIICNGNIDETIKTFDQLTECLFFIPVNLRIYFISLLDPKQLYSLIIDYKNLAKLLQQVDLNHISHLFRHIGSDHLQLLVPRQYHLLELIGLLSDRMSIPLIKAFANTISSQDIECYRGSNNELYERLSSCRQPSCGYIPQHASLFRPTPFRLGQDEQLLSMPIKMHHK